MGQIFFMEEIIKMNENFIGWGAAIPILIPFAIVLICLISSLIFLFCYGDRAVNIFNDVWGSRGPDGCIGLG